MIQCLLPRSVALFLTQQLSSIIWGKSDRFKAVGNLPHIYYKEAVKTVTNKIFFSHQGFAGWEIPFLCLVHLPCSWEEVLRAFSSVFYLLIPDPTLAVLLGLSSGDSW